MCGRRTHPGEADYCSRDGAHDAQGQDRGLLARARPERDDRAAQRRLPPGHPRRALRRAQRHGQRHAARVVPGGRAPQRLDRLAGSHRRRGLRRCRRRSRHSNRAWAGLGKAKGARQPRSAPLAFCAPPSRRLASMSDDIAAPAEFEIPEGYTALDWRRGFVRQIGPLYRRQSATAPTRWASASRSITPTA